MSESEHLPTDEHKLRRFTLVKQGFSGDLKEVFDVLIALGGQPPAVFLSNIVQSCAQFSEREIRSIKG